MMMVVWGKTHQGGTRRRALLGAGGQRAYCCLRAWRSAEAFDTTRAAPLLQMFSR